MTRQAEVAALHGHPTISEDNATIVRLRRQFPDWQIDRTPHGSRHPTARTCVAV